jgi:ankyrin repeat protein
MASDPDLIKAARQNKLDDVEKLLEEGANINATDDQWGQTAISWAAEKGHLDVVKALHERKADLQIGDRANWCPVDWATSKDKKDVLSFFLAQEEDGSHRYWKGRSLLFVAAQYGSVEDVKRFARRDNGPDHLDSAGMTPLMVAAQHGRSDHVVALLEAGADTLLRDHEQRSAFYWAATGGDIEAMRGLTKDRADLHKLIWDPQNHEATIFAFAATAGEEWEDFFNAQRPQRDRAAKDDEDRTTTALHFAAQHGIEIAVKRLLASDDTRVHARDAKGRTPLMWASIGGHIAVVDALLKHHDDVALSDDECNETSLMIGNSDDSDDRGVEQVRGETYSNRHINARDAKGWTALIWASIGGHVAVVHALLKHKADAALADYDENKTALIWAAEHGHNQTVEQICVEPDSERHINARDADGRTALIWASVGGYITVVDTLLKYKADVSLSDDKCNETALMWAAEHGYDQVVDRLCGETDRSRHINVRGWAGFTAMTFAALSGNAASVGALINAGADINVVDTDRGQSPLSWAAERKHLEVVKTLIAAGADLYTQSRGQTPVYFALRNLEILRAFLHHPRRNPDAGSKKIPRVRAAELALRYSCDVNHDTSSNTFSPDLRKVSRFILGQKECLEAVDEDGRNFISWAAQGGRHEELEMLLRVKQFDLNAKDRNGRSPLHWAAESGNGDVIEWLVDAQVSVDLADKSGRTPLSLAAGNGHAEVVTLLLSLRGSKAKTNEGVANRSKKCHAGIDVKDSGALVSVDSRDVEERTPLWHAVTKHHLAVFKILRVNGANPGVKDRSGKSLQQILVEEKLSEKLEPQAMAALDATLEQLRSAQALLSEPLGGVADIDGEFKATVLRVLENEQRALETSLRPLNQLLAEGPSDPQGSSCTWMHLPANNVGSS